ncbi:MAG: molybdate ABC transporter substrate-binding protein [Gammaproteobacteria bacterium]
MSAAYGTVFFSKVVAKAAAEPIAKKDDNKKDDKLLVFAAASLGQVMQQIGAAFERESGVRVRFNFAGSNVLARQIVVAPKADVFLSADTHWMDYLAEKNQIDHASRRSFLSNRLVFIAHPSSAFSMSSPEQLLSLPFRYFAMGDPEVVPVGRYAKTYLRSVSMVGSEHSLWPLVQKRVLPASDVTAATAMVAALPDVVGMVYKTDALASPRVRVLFEPTLKDMPPIRYEGAAVTTVSQTDYAQRHAALARDFLQFLSSPVALITFRSYGFTLPDVAVREESVSEESVNVR